MSYFTPEQAARFAKRSTATLAATLGVAALVFAVAAGPADAKKRKAAPKSAEPTVPEVEAGEPMTLIVSLREQRVDIYRGTSLVTSSKVSTGMRGYSTKAGVFTILEKKRMHHSNLYSGAPMPWMQRITWSGTALHAGVVPGYPASHGCIRLPFSFAPQLYKITGVGQHVVVAQDRPAPKIIEHVALFQPLPAPQPPTMVKQEPKQRQSSNELPAARLGLPVILAKAEISGIANDGSPTAGKPANEPLAAASASPSPVKPGYVNGSSDDTRTHAIDPFADQTPSKAHALEAVDPKAPAKAAESAPVEEKTAETTGSSVASDVVTAPTQATANTPEAAPPVVPVALSVPAAPEMTPEPVRTPSVIEASLQAGAMSAATQAAEPRSDKPLRVLVTRRTARDRIIGVQQILADMGYIEHQNFDGTIGKVTVQAIKAFQKANGMPETGTFNDEFVAKVYQVAGKGQPPEGHLWVRQDMGRMFDTPVTFKDPESPLGTHVFTAMKFAPGDTQTRWMAVSLQGDDAMAVLDRLEIPEDARQKISERLTPGSSLIVADLSINTAALAKGADFVVWAKDMPGKVTPASLNTELAPKPRKKRTRAVRPNPNQYRYNYGFQAPRSFRNFPW
jgi:lipoprotein-anchoring transpeptidase ErfK/SrfK/peptidoglycan hydrolase-like protein with peptidoglycan-binding domain